jgi:O-antigen/teichoic acid export membrane protein
VSATARAALEPVEVTAPPSESTFRPALMLMCGQALAFAGTFFIPVVLARVFDQATFGTYKQLFLLFSTLYLIAPFGMAESLFYFLPGRGPEAGRYVANSLTFLASVGTALLVALWWAAPQAGVWLNNPELPRYMPLLGAFLGLSMTSYLLEVVLTARKRYRWAAVSYGTSDLLRASFLVFAALVTRTLHGVFVGAVCFAVLRLLCAVVVLARELGAGLRPDGAILREQLAYAIPFGAAVLVHVVQSTFHQYAVSYAFDVATFAVYSVGCLNIPLLDLVVGPAGNVMMVGMAEQRRHGREAEAVALWHATVRRLALIFLPVTGLLVVTARPIIVLLFTESYLASVPIFIVWSLGMLWTIFVTDGVLRVYADTRFLLIQSGLRLALNVALMWAFLHLFGLIGAVLVTVSAAWITKGMCLLRIRRLMRLSYRRLLPWGSLGRILVAAAAAAAVGFVLERHLEMPPLLVLAAVSLAYAAVTGVLYLRAGVLEPGEREWLREAVRKVMPRSKPECAASLES